MSTHHDLTRWNRAGLRYFQYVDGNAVDYLERLREEMQVRFPDWEQVLSNGSDVDSADLEQEAARHKRALDKYYAGRADWGWEILRAFARATHVLGKHIDAYANEGFLETATQWDHIRKLVEMLDYHPAPPSSALTPLVLLAKEGRKGLVAKGFQVKYTPPEGGAPVVFESLEDVHVDSALNELHLEGWDRSPLYWDPYQCKGDADFSPWVVGEKTDVSVGDVAVLLQGHESGKAIPASVACRIEKVNRKTSRLCLQKPVAAPKKTINPASVVTPGSGLSVEEPLVSLTNIPAKILKATVLGFAKWSPWVKGDTHLLIDAKDIYVPHINGPDVVQFNEPHGLAADEVICWKQSGNWLFNRVIEHNDIALRLASSSEIPAGDVFKALDIHAVANEETGLLEFRVSLSTIAAAAYLDTSGVLQPLLIPADFDAVTAPETGEINYHTLNAEKAANALRLCIVRPGMPKIGTVAGVGISEYRFDGSPGDLKTGDWVVGEFAAAGQSTELQAMNIERINVREDSFTVEFTSVAAFSTGSNMFLPSLSAIETTLVEPVFNSMTLTELASGNAGEQDVSAIQGVGSRYVQAFRTLDVFTISDLANLDLDKDSADISLVRRRELKAKAELVLAFSQAPIDTGASGEKTLVQLAGESGELMLRNIKGSAAPSGLGLQRLLRLYGPFQETLRPIGYDINGKSVTGDLLTLDKKQSKAAELLKPGRSILLEQRSGLGSGNPKQAFVEKIENDVMTLNLKLVEDDGFTLSNTVIRGNVLAAGHGAFKGEKVLGSGDATQSNQAFIFKVPGIAFVADSTMPSGVRADIALRVDDRTWRQVSSLRDSGPADPHYTVHMTEQGFLNIGFGDGENGRRLPTGVNNLRVAYRVGSGLAGNIPAHGLQKPVKPHKLVSSVDQPIPATGGNNIEGTASLRENAPASLLTLERAVSLNDFANLAVSQSSVWQARAFAQSTLLGRQVSIRVVIVPAGGAGLDKDLNAVVPSRYLDNQALFLKTHTQPGIEVSTFAYQPVLIYADISIRVKYEEYDPEATKDKVIIALQQALALENRKLGQPLYRSELYRIVEAVTGVENSVCKINLEAGMEGRPLRVNTQAFNEETIIRSIQPKDTQVIYFEPEYSTLTVEFKEFEL